MHRIYFEECGNLNGPAVIFLHGGPGSGCNSTQRRFFDPAHYRIVLMDQRGCGRSTPEGETYNNTTEHLVGDIEQLRFHLNIARWHVFGGSWGSTLALTYACSHPQPIISLTLRGIFLSRPFELDWFLGQIQLFFPDQWQTLCDYLPESERSDPLQAFQQLVFSKDNDIAIPAAHIPTTIVQGRYDMVCPPQTAWQLTQAMPHAIFVMVPDAGHSAMEPGTCNALVAATEQYKHLK
ncbi:MAG: hypothetical protein B7Y48_09605 [Methylophilales bacterium 28-44-11]|nr:MAG: hypothetical protein B7Y48_09605 [Methylophilales bacterium 28-44-11]